MAKFLGQTGLIYLWGKIKSYVSTYVAGLNLSDTYVAKEANKSLASDTEKDTWNAKQDAISDLSTIRSGASSGATALQPNDNVSGLNNDAGYITLADVPAGAAPSSTSPNMDGTASVGTETAYARGDHRHPSDTSKQDTITDLATIRSGASAGATAYQKPATGIPKSDLASAVQTSLGKADTALQSFTEADPVFAASAAAGITSSNISAWDAKQDAIADLATIRSNAALGAAAVPSSEKGAAGGVCPLDSNTKIDAAYLPSYVDDVIEAYPRSGQTELSSTWLAAESASGTVITPESGKIYLLMIATTSYTQNTQFRWGGTTYVKINDGGITEMTTAEMDTATSNWT